MTQAGPLRSPHTGSEVVFSEAAGSWSDEQGREYPLICKQWFAPGIADFRTRAFDEEPWPASTECLHAALDRLAAGESFKSVLEALLRELEEDQADALQLMLKESRGGWTPLLRGDAQEALFIGNSISGTLSAIVACCDTHVTTIDRSPERLAFASYRNIDQVGDRATPILAGDGPRLPFADGAFDLVIMEEGLPHAASHWSFDFAELKRVCRGELALAVDNRFAYKRSRGLRGRYHIPGPIEYLRDAVRPKREERSLAGYRRILREFDGLSAFSLYPHRRDFTHVVALDAERPRLTIGPREGHNWPKMIGHNLGLFPHLTPSYLLLASRAEPLRQEPRIERIFDELSRELNEERGQLDVLVATRSNTTLIQCRPKNDRGDAHWLDPREAEDGRWTLHIPLSPTKRGLLLKHHRALEEISSSFPEVPVPEPLFVGEIGGIWLSAERRLAGLTAPHLTGETAPTRRMFRETSALMAKLVVQESKPLDEEGFERLVAARFALVCEHAGRSSTRKRVERMLDETREKLLGRELPLMFYHGDLRSKHIQVTREGEVLGFLDWGASEPCFLPYVDLLHLVAHQRKQEDGNSPECSWDLIRERKDLRDYESEALESYLETLGLDQEYRHAMEAIYPVLVAGMAEMNWDYSRPFWLHRCFGL